MPSKLNAKSFVILIVNKISSFFMLNYYKLFNLNYITSLFKIQIVQNVIYHFDKLCTYI